MYRNHHFPHFKDRNYLQLKLSPILEEFLIIEEILKTDQFNQNQSFIHIKWPENIGVHLEVLDYLNNSNYKMGKIELMQLEPNKLKQKDDNSTIHIEPVNSENLDSFLHLSEKEDVVHGEPFSKMKKEVYKKLFKQPHIHFIQAILDNILVGSVILISSEEYIEIDHLLTDHQYRNRGIASAIIQYTQNLALENEKTILLAVDAEDTPKRMYEKKGFHTVASQISVQLDNFS